MLKRTARITGILLLSMVLIITMTGVSFAEGELKITDQSSETINFMVNTNSSYNLYVTVEGGPTDYQWYRKKPGESFVPISGASSFVYEIFDPVASFDRYQYKCVISKGGESIESKIITLVLQKRIISDFAVMNNSDQSVGGQYGSALLVESGVQATILDAYYRIDGKNVTGETIKETDRPQLYIRLKAKEGYAFKDDLVVTHWPGNTDCNNVKKISEDEYEFVWDFEINDQGDLEPIDNTKTDIADKVVLTVEEPANGAKPATTIRCEGAQLKTITWYQETTTERGITDWTTMPSTSSFREGRKYMAEILLTPESGFVFAPKSDLNLTLTNTNYLTGGIASLSDSELLVRVQFEVAAAQKNPFVDVFESDYFYEPVLWAVEKGITTGTDATHFSPAATCTRGQVVTFLWRAAGSPAPSSSANPFTDVSSSDYYYNAVLWAVGKNITNGTSATTFGPNDGCTRGQVVTFLHRFENSPTPASTTNPFVDVSSSEYYYTPVLWAVGKGITNGIDATHFSPNDTCTRGQIVTFLYRDMK